MESINRPYSIKRNAPYLFLGAGDDLKEYRIFILVPIKQGQQLDLLEAKYNVDEKRITFIYRVSGNPSQPETNDFAIDYQYLKAGICSFCADFEESTFELKVEIRDKPFDYQTKTNVLLFSDRDEPGYVYSEANKVVYNAPYSYLAKCKNKDTDEITFLPYAILLLNGLKLKPKQDQPHPTQSTIGANEKKFAFSILTETDKSVVPSSPPVPGDFIYEVLRINTTEGLYTNTNYRNENNFLEVELIEPAPPKLNNSILADGSKKKVKIRNKSADAHPIIDTICGED